MLDLSAGEIIYLTELAARLKLDKRAGVEQKMLEDKNIALIFEKDSTRTRCAFEVAAFDQGANVTYLGPAGTQMGRKETVRDTARVLGRMYDGIEYRGYGQEVVETLAMWSGVPVWNGLTTEAHPTQALADILTIGEHTDKPLNKVSICFVGDARNNVANSLMVGAAKLGMDFRAVSPACCAPDPELLARCVQMAGISGGNVTATDDVAAGVKGCDFIYTDVWVSMGEPDDVWEQRIEALTPYRVDDAMMALAGNPDVKFMHCLPAFHNAGTAVAAGIEARFGISEMEVTDSVFESERSIVFDQAENRMHTIKAVMVATLAGEY